MIKSKSPKKQNKTEISETPMTQKKMGAKRGRKRKNYVPETVFSEQPTLGIKKETHEIDESSKEKFERELKSNKICI